MEEKTVKTEEVSLADTAQGAEIAPVVDERDEKIAELNDKYLRTAAELENTRRRAALDIDAAARNRAMGIARNFLPVVDAINAAMAHNPDDAGVVAMSRAIDAALTQCGIRKIESIGQPLNPQYHNAIQAIDAPENTGANTILEEMQAGYMFDDTVLRPAMVIVAK